MSLKIGGFQELSLLDYPGKISSIIFLLNCNFRCKYCYNADLLSVDSFTRSSRKEFSVSKVLNYLQSHKHMLDGVVITGGEPTVNPDVVEFIRKIKSIGLLVKLDTNGSNPTLLKQLIDEKLIDYIAMDIKAPLQKYKELCGYDNVSNIKASLEILKISNILREFRTTMWPQLTKEDILEITKLIPQEKLYLQHLSQDNALTDEARTIKNYTLLDIEEMVDSINHNCTILIR